MNSSIFLRALSAGALALLWTFPAAALERPDVGGLLSKGQKTEALAKVEAYLNQHPNDRQVRFQKGVVLTELERRDDAIAVFSRLVADFPDQPEYYNNLAVLYSANRQYDLARAALETALRVRPNYPTARENLGDVYAKLAALSYEEALKANSGNAVLAAKLTSIRNGVPNVGSTRETKTDAIASVPSVSRISAKPSSAATRPSPNLAVDADVLDAVLKTVEGWANAWSARDPSAYLAYYSSDFQTPHHQSRHTWERKRREQLKHKSSISVKVEAPEVTLDGAIASVKFHQVYVSNRFKDEGNKILRLAKQGDGVWKIVSEKSAPK